MLPHWGTQFADKADAFQKTWQQNFLDFGADIIFGDHTHSVQPMEMKEVNGKMTYTLFCPGNYANIYREHNGDASALVEVAIDRITKKIIGSSMIPMWTESAYRGNYRALPVWEILTDEKLKVLPLGGVSGICNPRVVGLWIYNPRGSQTRSYHPVDLQIHRNREKMRALRREVPSSFRNQTSQI